MCVIAILIPRSGGVGYDGVDEFDKRSRHCDSTELVSAQTICHGRTTVFETFAVLSTLGCIAVFVVMYRMDRESRKDDN